MNRNDLVREIATNHGLSQAESKRIMGTIENSIKEALTNGEKVTLTDFGTFERRIRQERKGINPHTGKMMKIPQKNVVAFRMGKAFKQDMNK